MYSIILLLLGLSIIAYCLHKKHIESFEKQLFQYNRSNQQSCSCNNNNDFTAIYTRGGNRCSFS